MILHRTTRVPTEAERLARWRHRTGDALPIPNPVRHRLGARPAGWFAGFYALVMGLSPIQRQVVRSLARSMYAKRGRAGFTTAIRLAHAIRPAAGRKP